jgi:hypothetical protein
LGENATQEENISNPFQKDTVEEKRRRIKQISKKEERKNFKRCFLVHNPGQENHLTWITNYSSVPIGNLSFLVFHLQL